MLQPWTYLVLVFGVTDIAQALCKPSRAVCNALTWVWLQFSPVDRFEIRAWE